MTVPIIAPDAHLALYSFARATTESPLKSTFTRALRVVVAIAYVKGRSDSDVRLKGRICVQPPAFLQSLDTR